MAKEDDEEEYLYINLVTNPERYTGYKVRLLAYCVLHILDQKQALSVPLYYNSYSTVQQCQRNHIPCGWLAVCEAAGRAPAILRHRLPHACKTLTD